MPVDEFRIPAAGTVVAVVVFGEPTAPPESLAGVLDCSGPDPALWLPRGPLTLDQAGLVELWRASFCETVPLGPVATVRQVQGALAAQGRTVDLCGGWVDQAAVAAVAEEVLAAIGVDSGAFSVAEQLRQAAAVAGRRHRGVQFVSG